MTKNKTKSDSNNEKEMVLNYSELCEKIEFLENYRKISVKLSANCVCIQNKLLNNSIEFLESQYNKRFKQLNVNQSHKNSEVLIDSNYSEVKSKTDDNNTKTDDTDVIEVDPRLNSQEDSGNSTQSDSIISTNSTYKRCDELKESTSSTDSMVMNSNDNNIVFRSITINNGSENSGNSVLVYDKVKNIIVRKSMLEIDKQIDAIIERLVLRETVDISHQKTINKTNSGNAVQTTQQIPQNNQKVNPLTPIVTTVQQMIPPINSIPYSTIGLPIITVPFDQSVLAHFKPSPIASNDLITAQNTKQTAIELDSESDDNESDKNSEIFVDNNELEVEMELDSDSDEYNSRTEAIKRKEFESIIQSFSIDSNDSLSSDQKTVLSENEKIKPKLITENSFVSNQMYDTLNKSVNTSSQIESNDNMVDKNDDNMNKRFCQTFPSPVTALPIQQFLVTPKPFLVLNSGQQSVRIPSVVESTKSSFQSMTTSIQSVANPLNRPTNDVRGVLPLVTNTPPVCPTSSVVTKSNTEENRTQSADNSKQLNTNKSKKIVVRVEILGGKAFKFVEMDESNDIYKFAQLETGLIDSFIMRKFETCQVYLSKELNGTTQLAYRCLDCEKVMKDKSHMFRHITEKHGRVARPSKYEQSKYEKSVTPFQLIEATKRYLTTGQQFDPKDLFTADNLPKVKPSSDIEEPVPINQNKEIPMNQTVVWSVQPVVPTIPVTVGQKSTGVRKGKDRTSEAKMFTDNQNLERLKKGTINSFKMEKYKKILVYLGEPTTVGEEPIVLYKCVKCGYETKKKYSIPEHLRSTYHKTGFSKEKVKQLLESKDCVLTSTSVDTDHPSDQNCLAIQILIINQENGTVKKSPILGYKCNFSEDSCAFVSQSPHTMLTHITIHREGKNYKCNVCEQRFATQSSAIQHNRRYHSDIRPLLECHINGCDFRTFLMESLEQHNKCHQTEGSPDSNDISDETIFRCDFPDCVRTYDNRSDLNSHMDIHRNGRIECDLCSKLLNSRTSLLSHKITSHNINNKPVISCPDCPYETISKSSFNAHKVIHGTDRPFKCDQIGCDKDFNFKYSLDKHKFSHSELRPCPCDWPGCDMTFKNRMTQRNHLRTHKIDNIRYGCDYCDITYKYKGDLNRHIKRDHLIDE